MANIRDIGTIASKWATVTPQRTADYANGVASPKTDWKTATTAANSAWKDGTQAAIAADRFNKAVGKSSTQNWQAKTVEKGTQRWGPGVQLAEQDYATKFAPFANAIKALALPPRFARRDPRNLARVQSVVNAMIATAQAQTG